MATSCVIKTLFRIFSTRIQGYCLLINLITLNNVIKDINFKEIINLIDEDKESKINKNNINEYLKKYINEYKEKNNIFCNKLKEIDDKNSEFLERHLDNLINKFVEQ